MERMASIIEKSLDTQVKCAYTKTEKHIRPDISSYAIDALYNIRASSFIASLLYGFHMLTKLIDKLPQIDSSKLNKDSEYDDLIKAVKYHSFHWKNLDLTFYWTRQSAIVITHNDTYLLPRSFLLLMHNKVSDLLSISILGAATPTSLYNSHTSELLEAFIKEFMKLAIVKDQEFFKISKLLEAIVIGETLKRVEGRANSAFLDSVVEEITESGMYIYEGSTLQNILLSCSTAFMHEMACLSKLMGHPFCDMKATADDMYAKTHEERGINIAMVLDAARYAKQDFICQYIRKTGKWPPVELDDTTPQIISEAYRKQIEPLRQSHPMLHGVLELEHWDHVEILRCERFEKLENFIPQVKDRTVSLMKSEVLRKHFSEEAYKPTKESWIETRALLAYLLLPYNSTEHLSYLELYANEEWEQMANLLVIRLVPKEKEHKDKARCFGCKPSKERARTIVLGHNAAKFLHRYSDSEAMTLSELTLSRKLWSFRNMAKAYRNYEQIIICLDASGWNSRLRNAALAPIASAVLDPVYGETMFRQFHETYHHMFVYLPDVQEVHHWDGQAGGVEGLDQYIWVMAYISHLKTVMMRFGFPFQLLVKGDDVRVVVLIPPQDLKHETIDQIRRRVVTEVTAGAAQYGHLMKVEDSYGSQLYCSFSKNAFIRNVEQPQSFRKCQKAYGANNAFMNTLDDYAASSYSNCHSTSKTSPSPISCYILALFWFLIALLRDKRYKALSDIELTALTLIPNNLGGFPIVYLHNFFQRAESDLLTSFCEIYLSCKKDDLELYEVLGNVWEQIQLDPYENVVILCMDPYSLPIYKPPPAQSVLRKHLRKVIQTMTKNHIIKDLFAARKSDFHETLMIALAGFHIYAPKVMSGIFAASPEGIIMELLTKFESGRSVMDAIILRKNYRKGRQVLREAREADEKVHEFRIHLIKGRLRHSTCILPSHYGCGTEMAQTIRTKLWRRQIEGITQPSVFHMVTIGTLSYFLPTREADDSHFEIDWSPPEGSKEGTIFKEGPYTAFLGDSTSKGLTHPEVKIMSESIFALKIAKLLDLYKWTIPQEERPEQAMAVSDLCAMMIEKYTGRTINEFLPFAAERPLRKTMQHHLRANQFRPGIVPNTLQNIYTWCQVNMLTNTALVNTHEHFLFNYHEIKCWCTSVMASRTWIGQGKVPPGVYWAVSTKCTYCSRSLVESSLFTKKVKLPRPDLIEHFDEARETIKEIVQEVDEFSPDTFVISDQDNEHVTPGLAAKALCQYIFDFEWESARKIEDSISHHHVSSRGMEVLKAWTSYNPPGGASFSDLRFVPMDIIINALIPITVGEILNRLGAVDVTTCAVKLGMVPSSSWPWSTLMAHLSTLHRIRELQQAMASRLREPALLMDNYQSYVPKFGAQCFILWTRAPTSVALNQIIILSNKADDMLRTSIRRRLNASRRLMFNQALSPYKTASPNERVAIIQARVILEAAARYIAFDHNYQLMRDGSGQIVDTEIHCLNMTTDVDVTDELINLEENHANLYRSLRNRFEKLELHEVRDILIGEDTMEDLRELDEEVGMELRGMFRSCKITLSKLDIVTCKEKVKHYMANPRRLPRDLDQDFELIPRLTTNVSGLSSTIGTFSRAHARQILSLADTEALIALQGFLLHSRRTTSPGWALKPLGAFNISISRYAFLFDQLKIRVLGEGKFCACLADGYGGAARVISKLVRRSQILFVTSPITSHENPIPEGILNDGRNNVLLTNLVEVGRHDLREMSNFLAMEQDHPYLLDICTCDAEVPPSKDVTGCYDKLWKNVAIYWARNCKPQSLFILKVYMHHYKTILHVITILRPMCLSMRLIQSQGSTWNKEVFLVCQSTHSIELNYDATYNSYPPSMKIRAFRTFWWNYNEKFRTESIAEDNVPLDPRYSDRIKEMCHSLPSYGWTQLEAIIKCNQQQKRLIIRENESLEDYWTRITTLVQKLVQPIRRELLDEDPVDRGEFAELYRSRTHKFELLYKVLILEGFCWVFDVYHLGHRLLKAEDHIQRQYRTALHPFEHLALPLTRPDIDHFSHKVKLHDEYDMYKAWVQGIRWGVAALTWGLAKRL